MKKRTIYIWLLCVSIIVLSTNDLFASSKKGSALAEIELISTAIKVFKLDVGRYPQNSEGLNALIHEPKNVSNWRGYLGKPMIPLDPWGQEYVYIYPPKYGDKAFDLYSFGPDGIDNYGLNDDLTNWRKHQINDERYIDFRAIWFLIIVLLFVSFLFIYIKIKKRDNQEAQVDS